MAQDRVHGVFGHPALPGLFGISATFAQHRFPMHIHDTFTLGVIVAGVNRFWNRGAHHHATRNTICVVNPVEPHTGGTCTPEGFSYLNLFIPEDLLAAAGRDLNARGAPRFGSQIIADREAVRALLRFWQALHAASSGLQIEERWLTLCALLLSRHVESKADIRPRAVAPKQIQTVRDVLDQTFDENLRLTDLAGKVGLSTFQLARGFTRHVGLSPHAYHLHRRIERARTLILAGRGLAEAAACTGFADQAHLTRHFRRHFAITPGVLQSLPKPAGRRGARKNVQYAHR